MLWKNLSELFGQPSISRDCIFHQNYLGVAINLCIEFFLMTLLLFILVLPGLGCCTGLFSRCREGPPLWCGLLVVVTALVEEHVSRALRL